MRLACSVLLLTAWLAFGQSGRVVIQAGTVLDGKGGVLRNQQIVVEDGKIRSVAAGKAKADYDLSHATVMPGWIDTHVHLNWHFDSNHKLVNGREPAEDALKATAENARATLEAAFTTVQSVGAAVDATVRDKIAAGELTGPR